MSKNEAIPLTIIEIGDSTDGSDVEVENTAQKEQQQQVSTPGNRDPRTQKEHSTSTSEESKTSEIIENSQKFECSGASTSKEATEMVTAFNKSQEDKDQLGESMPRKLQNRRKSVHHSIRSADNISFESMYTTKRRKSEEFHKETKKKRLDDDLDAVIDGSLDEPQINRLLRKVAYCRVFTNYLLRQYNMMTIDFKLYSNIDMLMQELKKRVDTYVAIRQSRQRLLINNKS